MAKIFWIAEKDGDYMEMFAFNNKRKAQEKALELAPHFSFGDTEIPKEEDDYDGDSWLYSGMINAKECFILYREGGMPYADGEFVDDADASRWVEDEGYDTAGACFPVKLKGGMGSVSISMEPEGNGTQLFLFTDGEVYEGKQTTMKYVPTFESFIGSQKVNEFVTMMEPFDEYGWNDEYDNKYAPIVKALKGKDMYDCVFLGEGFPDFLNETDPIKSFSLKGVADTDDAEDPHGDVEFDLYKFNGMLIGHFTDEMRYSAAVCNEKDAKKWARIFKQNDAGDYLY